METSKNIVFDKNIFLDLDPKWNIEAEIYFSKFLFKLSEVTLNRNSRVLLKISTQQEEDLNVGCFKVIRTVYVVNNITVTSLLCYSLIRI